MNLIVTFRAQGPGPKFNSAANRVPHPLGTWLPAEASCPPQSRTAPARSAPKGKESLSHRMLAAVLPTPHRSKEWGDVGNFEEQRPLLGGGFSQPLGSAWSQGPA